MLGIVSVLAGSSIVIPNQDVSFLEGNSRSHWEVMFGKRRGAICAAIAEAIPAEVMMMMTRRRKQPESLYEVLRVKRDASFTEIKAAYRSLAKMYHPDVTAMVAAAAVEALDGKEFIEIHKAYETLSDPAAREKYDSALRVNSRGMRRPMSYRSPDLRARAGFHPARRWETDQCW